MDFIGHTHRELELSVGVRARKTDRCADEGESKAKRAVSPVSLVALCSEISTSVNRRRPTARILTQAKRERLVVRQAEEAMLAARRTMMACVNAVTSA
jgi:hypothetical protein